MRSPNMCLMKSTVSISMVGVKSGVTLAGPLNRTLAYRAERMFIPNASEPLWHIEHSWRHDNLQPRPSAFAPDFGLAAVKTLDAAVSTLLMSSTNATSIFSLLVSLRTLIDRFVSDSQQETNPRLPTGAIERCNHWTAEGECGLWGWRGPLNIGSHLTDATTFSCRETAFWRW